MPAAKGKKYKPPNRQTVLDREERAWDMRLECKTYEEIGKELGVSKQAAWAIVDRVEKRERDRFDSRVDLVRSRQFGQQEKLMRKAWISLDESCKPRKQATLKTDEEGNEIKVEHAVEQTGDTKYSYLILAIHAAQRELTGTNIQAAANPGLTIADLALAADMEKRREEHEEEDRKAAQQQPPEEKPPCDPEKE